MKVACACQRYLIDPAHAAYHKDGRPMCNQATCDKVREHRHLNDADRVPNEVYAKRLYPDI
jgi:hypothetical protein